MELHVAEGASGEHFRLETKLLQEYCDKKLIILYYSYINHSTLDTFTSNFGHLKANTFVLLLE